MGDVLQQRPVAVAQRLPVVAVHVLDVEEVAEPPPDLVEDLRPFLGRHAVDHQPAGGHRGGVAAARRVDVPATPCAHQHPFAVPRHGVAADAVGDGRRLAVLERETLQRRLHVAAPAVVLRAGADEEHAVVRSAQPDVVVERHRQPHDAPGEPVELDDDGILPVPFALIVVAGRVVVRRIRFLAGRVVLFRVVVPGHLHLVALRRQRVLHVLPQRQGVDAGLPVDQVVPLERAELRRELPVRQVVEVVAVRIPGRVPLVEELVRDPVQGAVGQAPDPDGAELGGVGHRECQVAAAGRPDVVAQRAARLVGDLDDLLRLHVDDAEPAVLVAEGQVLAGRRPLGRVAASPARRW